MFNNFVQVFLLQIPDWLGGEQGRGIGESRNNWLKELPKLNVDNGDGNDDGDDENSD